MGFYTKHILPRAIHFACKQQPSTRQREKIVPLAKGKVLEIGIGSGLNLPFYDAGQVRHVTGIDVSPHVWARRVIDEQDLPFPFEFHEGRAEKLPFENARFDTVLVTYTMCSIRELEQGLQEIRRVLKDSGSLLFNEHGMAPEPGVLRWQKRIDPIWRVFSGGCSLSINMPQAIRDGGFDFETLEQMYIPGWKPASYMYWGSAKPR